MDEEQVLNLFDTNWFYHKSIQNNPSSSLPPIDPGPVEAKTKIERPRISHLRSLHRRSLSNQSSSTSDRFSPNSVLQAPKLDTNFSGKEAEEVTRQEKADRMSKKALGRRKKKGSRSLSELEFEELKGFLDLGFTFSEAEKDSRLLEIVPGLHRLGKMAEEEEEEPDDETVVSRPYLSEAWSFDRKEEDPLMNWRISAVGNEMNIKDQLKYWAHAVASTVI
ncbi:hypothetical protein AAC387_Pa12g2066 [Persea americana]